MKLIVNSHMKYRVTLDNFIDSLGAANFERWNQTVVIRGGANKTRIAQDISGITTIDWPMNGFDLTALSALYAYRTDARVKAKAYVYMLDTSEVGRKFPSLFDANCNVSSHELRMSPRPNSNMPVVFGAGLVDRYEHNFDYPLSKQEGLCHEVCGMSIREVDPLESFASKVRYLEGRRELEGAVDVYHTGTPRRAFYYPALDVKKYINWAHDGDITGDSSELKFDCWNPFYLATVASRTNSSLTGLPWRVIRVWYQGLKWLMT